MTTTAAVRKLENAHAYLRRVFYTPGVYPVNQNSVDAQFACYHAALCILETAIVALDPSKAKIYL